MISGYAVIAAELDKMKQYADTAKGSTAFSVNSDSSALTVNVSDQSLATAFDALLRLAI